MIFWRKNVSIVFFRIFFLNCEKKIEFVKKKTHVHSFDSIFAKTNQNMPTHITVMMIRYGNFSSNILDVGFFLNKLLQREFLFFLKLKKKYLQFFFLWKNHIVVNVFSLKKWIDLFLPNFLKIKKWPSLTFCIFLWPQKNTNHSIDGI